MGIELPLQSEARLPRATVGRRVHAAVDKNRSLGYPYWPEAFWTAIKAEIQATDLTGYYVIVLQHTVTRNLMQEVLTTYKNLGPEHFTGSPACFHLGEAMVPANQELDQFKLAKTQELIQKVYAVYKPQIKAARARYIAEHRNGLTNRTRVDVLGAPTPPHTKNHKSNQPSRRVTYRYGGFHHPRPSRTPGTCRRDPWRP